MHKVFHDLQPIASALVLTGVIVTATVSVAAESTETTFWNDTGSTVGRMELEATPNGLLLRVKFSDLPPGPHAFHIHETGKCVPPFETAGSHLAVEDGRDHGFRNENDAHAGDLPNLFVPGSGELQIDLFLPDLTLEQVLDEDGAAFVVHERADDYETKPAGYAGKRIACAALTSSVMASEP